MRPNSSNQEQDLFLPHQLNQDLADRTNMPSTPRSPVFLIMSFLLVGFVCVNLQQDPTTHTTRAKVELNETTRSIALQLQKAITEPPTLTSKTCRVQFVVQGETYVPKEFPYLPAWIKYTNSSCTVDIVRMDHAFFNQLTPAQSAMLNATSSLPILQVDFTKLLVLYYLGGLVADLDVEPRAHFPDQWTGPNTTLATCDVVLGLENGCSDIPSLRQAQIQNWAMYARHPHSPFLNGLIDFIMDKYEKSPPHNPKGMAVQEVAGSGPMTDYAKLFGDYCNATSTDDGGTLATDFGGVRRIRHDGEEVCIAGRDYTGYTCGGDIPSCLVRHHYEGSWKH
ncbi:Aste57867_12687 [Aphanomyces stellatus]|uniref:Aste57867_12687 protein n=1 Tax=Aphanomyces stellatus TaxID=120398 RepID=A0A485KW84_9STRA|nr:hypothetical protein As57867_012640 [Aphanomyces stellatus]VFT89537.1 Aste57867_12687 [Aphanomyces stellatus]